MRKWWVVVSAASATLVAFTQIGGPLALAVVVCFLTTGPGIGVLTGVDLDDVVMDAMLVVAMSWALAGLVATAMLYAGVFSGARVIGVLGVLAIGTVLWPRRAPTSRTSVVVPGSSRGAALALDLDSSVPVLLVRIGRYPIYHGSVAAIRSLGRAGVPVHAIVEGRFTPAARSRYLDRAIVGPTTATEPAEELLAGLVRIAEQMDVPTIAIPSDDEAAVFLAEHRDDLLDWLILPEIRPDLPRELASKRGLNAACLSHGVPTPVTEFPKTHEDIDAFIDRATFPVVVKNVDPFRRIEAPSVASTTVLSDAGALRQLVETIEDPTTIMLQEYLPRETSEDWIFHAYCDEESAALVGFTGVKLRSWPPHVGVTTFARAVPNEELELLATEFCRDVGYHGIADQDWRFDRRDGLYKLVDFNPRMGAQFALFETEAGVDVVRAQHLDLTGRRVPASMPLLGRGIRVEHLDLPAAIAYRGDFDTAPAGAEIGPRPVRAWSAGDDLAPAAVMVVRVAWLLLARTARRLLFRRQPRAATAAAVRGAENSVPQTKRIKGPKVAADDKPAK